MHILRQTDMQPLLQSLPVLQDGLQAQTQQRRFKRLLDVVIGFLMPGSSATVLIAQLTANNDRNMAGLRRRFQRIEQRIAFAIGQLLITEDQVG